MRDINKFIIETEKYLNIFMTHKKFRNELSELKEKVKYTSDEDMIFRWEELIKLMTKYGDERLFRYVFS